MKEVQEVNEAHGQGSMLERGDVQGEWIMVCDHGWILTSNPGTVLETSRSQQPES